MGPWQIGAHCPLSTSFVVITVLRGFVVEVEMASNDQIAEIETGPDCEKKGKGRSLLSSAGRDRYGMYIYPLRPLPKYYPAVMHAPEPSAIDRKSVV